MSMHIKPDFGHQERGTSGPRPTMDAFERQQVFREMVALQLSNGPLSTRRRRTLVQYAAGLGINAIQAGRLVQQARAIAASQDTSLTLHRSVSASSAPRKSFAGQLITAALWSAVVCLALLWAMGL